MKEAKNILASAWSHPSVRFLFYGLMGIWAIASDPFRISSATDNAIAREYADAFSRTTPVAMPPLTVVTIDSASIDELFNGGRGKISVSDWPIAYADHAAIITQIARGKPHPPVAIFYDILFEKPRQSSGNLEHFNRRVSLVERITDIPVFLAAGGPDMSLSDATYEVLTAPRFVRTNWHEEPGIYPLSFISDEERPAQDRTIPEGVRMETLAPATALYQAYCSVAEDCLAVNFDADAFLGNLTIHWPMRANQGHVSAAESCLSDNALKRYSQLALRIARSMAQALFNIDGPQSAAVECLPINTVQVSDLFSDNNPADLAPPGLEAGRPYVVMVGVVMPSAGDYHQTPVYEKLPGVFFHGAAFENLYRMGSDYFYNRDLTWFSVAIWLVASLAMMVHARYRQSHPVMRAVPVFLLWWGLLISTVLLMQLLFTNFLRIVPEGWLSMVAILPLLREVVMRHEAVLFQRKEKNNEKTGAA